MGAVALRPIHKVRLKNLTDLIDKRFNGNASEAARAIERSHTFIWQLVNGYRSIGEETARNIEQMLGLGENALDAKMERTTSLVVLHGDGTATTLHMVPMLALDQLDAKPAGFRPCPDEQASAKAFGATVLDEAMAELAEGDVLFADPARCELANRKLYVVTVKGKPKVGRVMQAKRVSASRWAFIATGELAKRDKPLDLDEVQVLGRVILVIRNL